MFSGLLRGSVNGDTLCPPQGVEGIERLEPDQRLVLLEDLRVGSVDKVLVTQASGPELNGQDPG